MSAESEEGADEFPSGRFERGRIAAQTGLKMGANYARYLARRSVGAGSRDEERKALRDRNARDLFSQLSRLRGTALKFAQGISIDPGVLPREFVDVLSQAQYQVPPMGTALVRRLIQQGLGKPPESLFEEFEPVAVAAASLGQVHRARLKDGRVVAVKIQYPNVRESVDSDLRIMKGLASRFVDAGAVQPFLDEVRARMFEETDYLQEGQNIEYFAAQYTSDRILTPRWIPEYSSERVLTMTFVEGRHLDEFLATDPSQDVLNQFGQTLWDFAHEQVAANNLAVHADAHPGNFLFRDDGRVGVLDFGCIKRFPVSFRNDLLLLFKARLADDQEALMRQYRSLLLVSDEQPDDLRAFMLDILEQVGNTIAEPYRHDTFDFGANLLLQGFEDLLPRLTGREAYRHRSPVGSSEFIFLNRLVFGLLSILTRLGAVVHTADGRRRLLDVADAAIG